MQLKWWFEGRWLTVSELAKMAGNGVNERVLKNRLRDGWTIRQALETPAERPKKPAVIFDIRLYYIACFVQRQLLCVWNANTEPIRQTDVDTYELKRHFYTYVFKYTGPMTFDYHAVYRKTGKISEPTYECRITGKRIMITHVRFCGRREPYRGGYESEATTDQTPAAYRHSVRRA